MEFKAGVWDGLVLMEKLVYNHGNGPGPHVSTFLVIILNPELDKDIWQNQIRCPVYLHLSSVGASFLAEDFLACGDGIGFVKAQYLHSQQHTLMVQKFGLQFSNVHSQSLGPLSARELGSGTLELTLRGCTTSEAEEHPNEHIRCQDLGMDAGLSYLEDEKEDHRLLEAIRDTLYVREGDTTYPVIRRWVHVSVSILAEVGAETLHPSLEDVMVFEQEKEEKDQDNKDMEFSMCISCATCGMKTGDQYEKSHVCWAKIQYNFQGKWNEVPHVQVLESDISYAESLFSLKEGKDDLEKVKIQQKICAWLFPEYHLIAVDGLPTAVSAKEDKVSTFYPPTTSSKKSIPDLRESFHQKEQAPSTELGCMPMERLSDVQ
ncbi:hypothetical protein ARMGADRAFT_1129661 [Armillaria gallica]|uniref:Uncharacterized protein n=1 Tax=Armillaria gallica TaxID=47427 RepID=A0A2H3DCL5_ARMGA|nr:hypothetical protein ARMGADRAFT_1129661 [Armillaria gallica]